MSNLTKDRLEVYVKHDKLKLIEKCYGKFGWNKVSETENNRYADLVDVTFERAHKIDNKDNLQLMQVHMEHYLNDIGVVERKRHSKSTALGLCLGLISVGLVGVGLWLIFQLATTIAMIFGAIAMTVAIVWGVVVYVVTTKIYKEESRVYEDKINELMSKLDELCNDAERLQGGGHGE